jgi:hypothetical protein
MCDQLGHVVAHRFERHRAIDVGGAPVALEVGRDDEPVRR